MGIDTLTDTCAKPVARLALAHGAGAPMDSPFMDEIAKCCCSEGLEVVRFEFPYMAQRRRGGTKRPPNKQNQLLEVWQQVIEQCADDDLPLFIGGKSMGGRMATLLAADRGLAICRGIICFGYPFHPPGKPDKLRVEHLPRLGVEALIIQGGRDSMGNQAQVEGYQLGPKVRCHWVPTANHDLVPLKRSGITAQQALCGAAAAAREFVDQQLGLTRVDL